MKIADTIGKKNNLSKWEYLFSIKPVFRSNCCIMRMLSAKVLSGQSYIFVRQPARAPAQRPCEPGRSGGAPGGIASGSVQACSMHGPASIFWFSSCRALSLGYVATGTAVPSSPHRGSPPVDRTDRHTRPRVIPVGERRREREVTAGGEKPLPCPPQPGGRGRSARAPPGSCPVPFAVKHGIPMFCASKQLFYFARDSVGQEVRGHGRNGPALNVWASAGEISGWGDWGQSPRKPPGCPRPSTARCLVHPRAALQGGSSRLRPTQCPATRPSPRPPHRCWRLRARSPISYQATGLPDCWGCPDWRK